MIIGHKKSCSLLIGTAAKQPRNNLRTDIEKMKEITKSRKPNNHSFSAVINEINERGVRILNQLFNHRLVKKSQNSRGVDRCTTVFTRNSSDELELVAILNPKTRDNKYRRINEIMASSRMYRNSNLDTVNIQNGSLNHVYLKLCMAIAEKY